MAVIVPAAISAAYGIYQVANGAHQKNLANQAAANNVRPQYQIPQYNYNNLSLAESRAGSGLDASTKQYLTGNADRGLSASLNSVLRGGGNANQASSLYDTYLGNIGQVGLMNNQAAVQNMNNLVNQNTRMSDLTDKQWQINTWGPYADKQAQIAQQRTMGQNQEQQGFGTLDTAAQVAGKNLTDANKVNNIGVSGGNIPGAYSQTPTNAPISSANMFPAAPPAQSYMPPMGSSNYGVDISAMHPNDANIFNSMFSGYGSGTPYSYSDLQN